MAFADILNRLTERSSIETVLHVTAADSELIFFYVGETPDELRITFRRKRSTM
jgi:hypothetical protein